MHAVYADPLTVWMFSRCRAAAKNGAAGAGNPWVEFWYLLMLAWAVPMWIISAGGLILHEALLVSRLRISGVIEGMSGVMLILLGVIMKWSNSTLMYELLGKILNIEIWIWSSTSIGLFQLLMLRFGSASKRSVTTAFAFIWWMTMAMRLYSYGLLLTHSQLITMSVATALSLFILRFQTESECDRNNGQSKR